MSDPNNTSTSPDATFQPGSDISGLSYEQAKEELVTIVATLESGSASLEESMRLWERGEKLATRCTQWLDQAQEAVDGSTGATGGSTETAGGAVGGDAD
ncbi:MAG: exodeoxyribonuclease VII small subunit [Intrasporangiaceae bacterium]|nr:exodeoxyribonuclease VII small subunit [Intrasporangiaceae bacterium]